MLRLVRFESIRVGFGCFGLIRVGLDWLVWFGLDRLIRLVWAGLGLFGFVRSVRVGLVGLSWLGPAL